MAGVQRDDVHLRAQDARAEADVARRLELVAREHPQLDSCHADANNRLLDTILQLVLDGGDADHGELRLELVGRGGEQLVAAGQRLLGLFVLNLPDGVLSLCQHPPGKYQSAETFLGELCQRVLDARSHLLGPVEHDVVGALDEQHYLARLSAHDDRHALPRRREGIQAEDMVLGRLFPRVQWRAELDHRRLGLAADEGAAELRCGLHERALVRTLGLVAQPPVLVGRGHHGVGDGQHLHKGIDGLGLVLVPLFGLPHVLAAVEAPSAVEGAVHLAADRDLFQLHDVLSQRARLVREDVGHLPEFVPQVRGPGVRRHIRFVIVHVQVALDEVGLREVAHLHRGVERDGHEVGEEHEEREPRSNPGVQDDVFRLVLGGQIPVAHEPVDGHVVEDVADQRKQRLRSDHHH
mmetsp:Transcript_39586/g.102482  ORF Transcript_39586/g.102482 Transcript_39586/m.102482 type:complete len:408 (-) Transcript_39586:320-1543(-)